MEQNNESNLNPNPGRGGKILNLLLEGHCPAKVARLLECSEPNVWKHIRKYERRQVIERINKYPALFQRKRSILTPIQMGRQSQPPDPMLPLMLPHKFGADFYQMVKPNLPKDKNNLSWERKASHTARFGTKTTTIWLKAFRGSTIEQVVSNAQSDTLALADAYSSKYGLGLAFKRWHLDVEWAMTNPEMSKATAKQAGIKKHTTREVAGALHKFGDSSHPEDYEINALPKGDQQRPTEQARTHEYLYSRLQDDMELLAKTMKEVGDAIVSINQRIMQLERTR